MKRAWLGTIALVAFLGGCSKDAEFDEFMKENSSLGEEVDKAREKGGAKEARKAFDDKKDGLKKKYDAIKDARGFQVKEETQTKLAANLLEVMTKMCLNFSLDKKEAEELDKICEEYKAIMEMDK